VESANSADNYFTDAAIQNALNLAAYLMEKHNIPIENVVRHYDISGKFCPGIIGWNADSGSDAEWIKFKARLKAMAAPREDEIDMTEKEMIALTDKRIADKLIGTDTEPSEWAKQELSEAVTLGITDGSRPVGYATREEAAVMVLRAIKRGVGESVKQAVAAVIERVKGAL
jgi:N-acetyl-anhydromuramyl-L-alanine amidase AmpD